MKKIKMLQLIIGILVLVNLALLGFIFFEETIKTTLRKANAESNIRRAFGFDEAQMQGFQQSRYTHRENHQKLMEQLNTLGRSYYLTPLPADKATILDSILHTSQQIYLINDQHFSEIRALCDPQQAEHMEEFIRNIMLRTTRHRKKKPRKNNRDGE